jgi:hypothetical protein
MCTGLPVYAKLFVGSLQAQHDAQPGPASCSASTSAGSICGDGVSAFILADPTPRGACCRLGGFTLYLAVCEACVLVRWLGQSMRLARCGKDLFPV